MFDGCAAGSQQTALCTRCRLTHQLRTSLAWHSKRLRDPSENLLHGNIDRNRKPLRSLSEGVQTSGASPVGRTRFSFAEMPRKAAAVTPDDGGRPSSETSARDMTPHASSRKLADADDSVLSCLIALFGLVLLCLVNGPESAGVRVLRPVMCLCQRSKRHYRGGRGHEGGDCVKSKVK